MLGSRRRELLIRHISLEPEPIPLNIKIILFGDRETHLLMKRYDPEFKEHAASLRKNSVQEQFNGYYFDHQLAEVAMMQKDALREQGIDLPEAAEGDVGGSILDNPDLLLQQFNH